MKDHIFILESKWRYFKFITKHGQSCDQNHIKTYSNHHKYKKKTIKLPTIQGSQEIKQKLYYVAKFLGIIGAIDCTHIPIKSPGGDNAEIYTVIGKDGCP